MNRTHLFATVLAAGLTASTLLAQEPAATTPAPAPAAPVAVAPEAIPAKIAVIAFEQVVVSTNEGQKAIADLQKKYQPKKDAIDAGSKELDSLKAQNQALPATATDEARTKLLRDIDKKEKDLQHEAETASNDYQSDLQEAFGKVAQKVGGTAVKYAQDHGFTILLNVSGSQQQPNPFMWEEPKTDISQAVVNEYNKVSGVAPPPPSAPAPHRTTAPSAPKPAPKQ
jgi:outer membrane protein